MPIFHFNLADHQFDADLEGTECASLAEARTEAVVFAGAYLRDHPDLVADDERFVVDVTDDAGRHVFAVCIETRDA